MSEDLQQELKTYFRGLKRKSALAIRDGQGNIKIGKDPLTFTLYRYLGLHLLLQPSRDYIFARCFMILCWNLMSRAGNAFSVCHNHMDWGEDSLCIYFAHMKNDQLGERPRDPRHVFANPLIPEICPILAIGLHWLCYKFTPDDIHLLPGSNQYERYRKILRRMSNIESISAELKRMGIKFDQFGTHSMRKGSATFTYSF